jgi:hypothetical protein
MDQSERIQWLLMYQYGKMPKTLSDEKKGVVAGFHTWKHVKLSQ